jgi:hypothetical protein
MRFNQGVGMGKFLSQNFMQESGLEPIPRMEKGCEKWQ